MHQSSRITMTEMLTFRGRQKAIVILRERDKGIENGNSTAPSINNFQMSVQYTDHMKTSLLMQSS